jgi:sugar phosphate isomerase/epimerase
MKEDVQQPTIRIGNQTAYSAGSVMEPFEFALASDFNCFEFFPDRGHAGIGGWAEDDLTDITRRWIRESAAAKDMELTVHATLEFDPLHHPDHPRLHRTVRFACDIGATLVNLHLDATQGIEAFVTALGPTLKATAEAGLKLAIENTVWTGPGDFNALFTALQARADLPTHHAGMCLDLGHANLAGEYRNDFLGFVDALDPAVPIIHLHLHENWGDRDSHLTLFTGPSRHDPAGLAGLLKRLARRGFKGCAILEQWPHPPWELVEARDRLGEMIPAATI